MKRSTRKQTSNRYSAPKVEEHELIEESRESAFSPKSYQSSPGKSERRSRKQRPEESKKKQAQKVQQEFSVVEAKVESLPEVQNNTFGSWGETKAEEIEDYLVGQERRYRKYRLNIFVLNRVSAHY